MCGVQAPSRRCIGTHLGDTRLDFVWQWAQDPCSEFFFFLSAAPAGLLMRFQWFDTSVAAAKVDVRGSFGHVLAHAISSSEKISTSIPAVSSRVPCRI